MGPDTDSSKPLKRVGFAARQPVGRFEPNMLKITVDWPPIGHNVFPRHQIRAALHRGTGGELRGELD
jgi:hypothetical protein